MSQVEYHDKETGSPMDKEIAGLRKSLAGLETIFHSLPESDRRIVLNTLRGMIEQAIEDFPRLAEIVDLEKSPQDED